RRMADYFEENYEQVAGIRKFDYRYAELYVDTGLGFNENQAQVKGVGGHETEISFELNPYEPIKELRFDPVNDFCALHLEGIFLERADGSVYEAGDFSTNAVYREQKELIFSTGDPQIYLSIFEEKLQRVIFRLRYIALGKEAMGYFGIAHSRIIARLNEALQERIVEVYREKSNQEKAKDDGIELQHRIENLESELTRKIQAIDAMTASASWRWTGPLRNARRYILKILNRIYRYRNASYKQILASGLFEPAYYAEQRGDKERVGEYLLLHYVRYGAKEGRSPHPLFDSDFYLEDNPEAAASGINPLVHFIAKGAAEKRNPHPLFNTRFYLEQNPDAAEAGENPLSHYLKKGSVEGKTPHPLFDPNFYREQNPDVTTSGIDPLVHYVTQGWIEKRDPHPLFNTRYYMKQNPDPSAIGKNPLIHYLKEVRKKGKSPQILFDPEYYLKRYPDVARAGVDPLMHYVTKGGSEKRDPHPLFDALHYLRQVLPAPEASRNPLAHYLQKGKKAGLSTHPLFDTAFYLFKNPDVAKAGMDPLEHFIRFGMMDGRCTHKYFDSAYYLEQYPDARESKKNPLVHYLEVGLTEGRRTCSAWDLLHHLPLISLVMPVYDPEPDHLRIALDSVMAQIYPFWELCVVDDGSTNDTVRDLLSEYAAKDKRIKTFFSPKNQGIAAASNQAIRMAKGEFVGFLDHDDALSMDALMEITEAVNRHGADMIYSDEKVIDAKGFHRDFILKPDFSPDLLFSLHHPFAGGEKGASGRRRRIQSQV
ncbi:MAG: glycosyltransferase, partial [Deltaproteobacteria bacterium]|nr:glycosyltransferase [Deltaproteobacteria bacterium]